MSLLQPLDCLQYLPNLIDLRHSLVILDIDAWIAMPRRFVDSVAGTRLPGFAKHCIAYLAQINKPHCARIPPHIIDDVIDTHHDPCDINIDTILNIRIAPDASINSSPKPLSGLINRNSG